MNKATINNAMVAESTMTFNLSALFNIGKYIFSKKRIILSLMFSLCVVFLERNKLLNMGT